MSIYKKILVMTISLSIVIGLTLYKKQYKNPHYFGDKYTSYYNGLQGIDNGLISQLLPTPDPYLIRRLSQEKLDLKIKYPSEWVVRTIDSDFNHYSKFDKESVWDSYEQSLPDDSFVFFTIKDRKVTYQYKNPNMIEAHKVAVEYYRSIFTYLAEKGLIGDLVFNFRMSDDTIKDYSGLTIKDLTPIIAVTKNSSKHIDQYSVLVPDWQNLMSWFINQPNLKIANNNSPWETKIPVIFWRGGEADVSGYRHKLVELSKSMGYKKLDAQFTYGPKATATNVDVVDHIKYKYQITIDGHTAAWERPVWQLYSNSVMLKQASTLIQWYYNAIESGKHYVDVGTDPAELISIVENYSDKDLKDIADAGTAFAEENLMPEDMVAYLILVLQKYEKLQTSE